MTNKLKIWLWVSVVLAIGGAVMLYPIGTCITNTIFVIIKIGMVSGLMVLIFARKIAGYCIWASFSLGAVVMTIIKISFTGSITFLFIGSIFVDIFMPVIAYLFMRHNMDQFRAK